MFSFPAQDFKIYSFSAALQTQNWRFDKDSVHHQLTYHLWTNYLKKVVNSRRRESVDLKDPFSVSQSIKDITVIPTCYPTT